MRTIPPILLEKADELERRTAQRFPDLAPLARPCFLNTIETTVQRLADGSYFVITGDIPAMWLRDSAAQLKPYIKYAGEDPALREILRSVLEKYAFYVNLDPYSNAFNSEALDQVVKPYSFVDYTDFESGWIWERKYEVDSLCAPILLAYEYFMSTDDRAIFTEGFRLMLQKIVQTFTVEQRHGERSPYWFVRENCPPQDRLAMEPKGRPVNFTGMTWSGFRPSDDGCQFGYLIPANMMAVVALRQAAELAEAGCQDEVLRTKCLNLAAEIEDGIEAYGKVLHPKYGMIYAYETDGFGNHLLMDDANSPSLLSIPYLGYRPVDDPVYQNTRRFALSQDNPYYFVGSAAQGIGSPHTPAGHIWHMSLCMRALTSTDPAERRACLEMVARTHAGTNFMHESFHADDPTKFTRSWFAWANSLFAQALIQQVGGLA